MTRGQFSRWCTSDIRLRCGNTSNIFFQLVVQQIFLPTCRATLLHCKLVLAVAHITTYLANSSCNKIICSSCEMMLQEVESTSTFCNKILICCSYYHAATTCHATNLIIHACDWLRSFSHQRTRMHTTWSKKRKTNMVEPEMNIV